MDIGKIHEVNLCDELQKSYLDYAMSVIVSRALPDVRDGLKPVHRRILYAMHQMNLHFSGSYTKSAKVVGETMGKYHPHGDMPIYDALVRLAQDFSMRYQLISGQGNFGSIDGDPPAAMRYTEVKMAKITEEMLLDIDKNTVPFIDNFDGTLKEPLYLPAKLPNLLLMGGDGIAVGMATKIPPHNLSEVVDALILIIEKTKVSNNFLQSKENGIIPKKHNEAEKYLAKGNKYIFDIDVTVQDLMQYIKGPDFPTAGAIFDINEITNAYLTGKGKITIQGKAVIEELSHGKSAIIISEIPYQVNKASLVEKIAQLVKIKKIEGISDLRDESDRRGIRVVIELKRDSRPKAVLNNLYKCTQLQTVYPVNMVALVDGVPQTLNLKIILSSYVKHRFEVITLRSEYELKQAKERAHILEGLKIAIDNIDEVIETIKKSQSSEDAKNNLMKKFSLTEKQAIAILDMQLKRLAALERGKIEDEYQMLQETISYLEKLLADPQKILGVCKDELIHLKGKFGDARITRVYKNKVGEFTEEDLISKENVIITKTEQGYIKRIPQGSFKIQRRGGKGVTGMKKKQSDEITQIINCSTHDNILFFTNKGKAYQLKAWEIPEGSRTWKGQAIINLINIETDERPTSILTYNPKSIRQNNYIFMVTEKGVVKKTKLKEFENIRSNGLIAIKLQGKDQLVWTDLTSGNDQLILASYKGKAIRFEEKWVRNTNRNTMGVRGIRLSTDDYVISASKVENQNLNLLVVMERGIGKRTAIKGFPLQRRGGKGVKIARVSLKTGGVSAVLVIPAQSELLLLTSVNGHIIKLPIRNIPLLARATQGVILMRFKNKEDGVAAATILSKDEN